jgi:TonB-dependent receptor
MSNTKSLNRFAKNKTFKYSLVATAIIGLTAPTFAEETAKEDVEVIEVTGIRGALITGAETKREANTFVDSISASDANALPDLSVAEALSRIPGITVSRFIGNNSSNDFPSPEGSGNLIRGLSYIRSEFNGRDAFSADGGRALDWSAIPPQLVGGVDVYKNQSADLIEGGIGGSINLRTLNPFDKEEGFATISVDGVYTDLREEFSPSFSIVLGDRWKTDHGEFGLLGSYSSSELKSGINGFQAGAPTPVSNPLADDGSTVAIVPGFQLRTNEVDRDRESIYLAGQWQNNDDTLEVLVKYINVNNESDQFERTFEHFPDAETAGAYNISELELSPFTSEGIALCNGNNENPVGACDELMAVDAGLMESGLVTSSFRSWIGAQGVEARTLGRSDVNTSETDDISINVKWRPSDDLAIEFDAHRTTAESSKREQWIGTQAFLDYSYRPGLENPELEFFVNENHTLNSTFDEGSVQVPFSTPTGPSDPGGYSAIFADDQFRDGEGELIAVKTDVTYFLEDNDWFESVKFGARYSEREQINKVKEDNWTGLNTPWDGGLSPMNAQEGAYYDVVDFSDFFRGGVVKGQDTSFVFFGEDYIRNQASFFDLLKSEPDYAPVQYDPLTNRDGSERRTADYQEVYKPNDISDVVEETINLYAMVNFAHDFDNDMDLSGNLGVRYVKNSLSSNGTLSYAQFSEDTQGPITPEYPQSAEDRDHERDFLPETAVFLEQGDVPATVDIDEDYFLPSLNVKLNLNDDMLIRFGASKAITRPEIQKLRASQSIEANTSRVEFPPLEADDPNFGINQGAQDIALQNINLKGGNPILMATESINLDLSFEWYFENGGYISTGIFKKDIENIIQEGTRTISQVTLDGQTVNNIYDGDINVADADIQGVEIATQYFFTDDLPGFWANFGFQANYTYIDASQTSPSSPPDTNGDGIPDEQANRFALDNLLGQSDHTANLIAIYQGDDLETRLAYTWRSEYLTDYRDFVPGNPVFQEGGGILDLSIRYDITESLNLSMLAANILDAKSKSYQQIDESGQEYMRSSFLNDRRIQVGVTYQF